MTAAVPLSGAGEYEILLRDGGVRREGSRYNDDRDASEVSIPISVSFDGVADPFEPADNIDGGARYLAQLLSEFDGDLDLAAAAYNAGPNAVYQHGGIPPYDETREYVRRVKILYKRYQGVL